MNDSIKMPAAVHEVADVGLEPSFPEGDSFASYGCKVNDLSIDDLFDRYQQAGFLYPEKIKKLSPYLALVKENWRKARRAGELIQWVSTFDDPSGREWSSMSSWLSTTSGWVTQHLVATGSPLASRAVMLGGLAMRMAEGHSGSHQSWFQRKNRYANKIFGSCGDVLGHQGWTGDYGYYHLPLCGPSMTSEAIVIGEAGDRDVNELKRFLSDARSAVFVQAEDVTDGDLQLEAVDQLYNRVGLRRYRRVLIARNRRSSEILGVVLAYRGPLGLNFSFLENRCDVIIKPGLSVTSASETLQALCDAARPIYADFEPQVLPVVVDLHTAPVLTGPDEEHVRDYAQSIYLNAALPSWYRHVSRFYDGLLQAGRRRGFGAAAQMEKR